MISLFGSGHFVRVDIHNPEIWGIGRVGLLMGFGIDDGMVKALVSGEEGEVSFVDVSDIRLDFKYDVEKDRFIDASAEEPPGFEEDVPIQ
jgi:hypothetical protein